MSASSATPPPEISQWLVRISEVFSDQTEEVLRYLGAQTSTKLGNEYYLIKTTTPQAIRNSDVSKFLRWNLPVTHSWPCNPQKTENFIEKAAQALFRKFGEEKPQTLLIGQLDPGAPHKYYKTLASNLRGRALQLFPSLATAKVDAEDQDPNKPTLFCLVGKEGIFCGIQTPRESNGFFPGGTKYISQSAPGTISRAGAKIAEALHYLRLYRPLPEPTSHWLELGASPGGMTSELLNRKYRVTAVDRAPLDERLNNAEGLKFVRADAIAFIPKPGVIYHAILCDMNGDARDSMRNVLRLSKNLQRGSLVVFTLKMPDAKTVAESVALQKEIVALAAQSGVHLFAQTHLTYNRHEFTLLFNSSQGTGR